VRACDGGPSADGIISGRKAVENSKRRSNAGEKQSKMLLEEQGEPYRKAISGVSPDLYLTQQNTMVGATGLSS